jgi:hypothetical protein
MATHANSFLSRNTDASVTQRELWLVRQELQELRRQLCYFALRTGQITQPSGSLSFFLGSVVFYAITTLAIDVPFAYTFNKASLMVTWSGSTASPTHALNYELYILYGR